MFLHKNNIQCAKMSAFDAGSSSIIGFTNFSLVQYPPLNPKQGICSNPAGEKIVDMRSPYYCIRCG